MNSQTIYYGQNNLSMSLSKAYLVQTPVSSSKYRHVEKCRGSSYSRHHPTPFLMNNELTTASMSNSLLFTTADFQYALDPADSQVIKFETGKLIQSTCHMCGCSYRVIRLLFSANNRESPDRSEDKRK